MRTNKELILASKPFAKEDRGRSWRETFLSLFLLIAALASTFFSELPIGLRLVLALLTGLLYVRMFVIYHDYQHHAILQNSKWATFIMKAFGIFILAPQNIWKRSHDHHHNHNSKLTKIGIGSYPTITKTQFLNLSKGEQKMYLINRHPLTVIFGYFTLFIYWLNVKSFVQSPGRHFDSFVSLLLHCVIASLIWIKLGILSFLLCWFTPFFFAFAVGSYLFYCQHNFPGAKFSEGQDWKYVHAALASTSYMKMNPFMEWMTGYIGLHHVHHLNSRIPFYRLKEAMANIPELHNATITDWNPISIWKCFRLKLWDVEKNEMIPLSKL